VITKLETLLSRHLHPVQAPDELWQRIQGGEAAGRSIPTRWPFWAIAAAAAAMLALCFSLRSATAPELEKLAARESRTGGERLDFRSGDPLEIRNWVKTHAGLDVPMPGKLTEDVQLIGVSLLPGDQPVACISYRVRGQVARLLVTHGEFAGQHSAAPPANGPYSWTLQRQTYLLASSNPQETSAACVLCHLDARSPRS
jgi:hypothetical protein